jgi:hypothetical protein
LKYKQRRKFFNIIRHKLDKGTSECLRQRGKYDLKSSIVDDGTPSYAAIVIGEWSFLNGQLKRYDDYGNISYGIFGTKAGFSSSNLLEGSDDNQQGKLDGSGDEFRDKFTIKLGINASTKF